MELQAGNRVTPAIRLLRPLGQGGMGRVWIADHEGLQTQVVVKFMADEVAEQSDAAVRFKREASVAASVKSPHVVQVFDHGITDGVPYIVMELLEGRDLADHLAKHGRMAPIDVANMIAQVAKALGKAHQVGVIHRDIKPENIFLCDANADDGAGAEMFVKLLDFGIAKRDERVESAATTTGQVVGTPYYMSPEQIVGEKVIDARTDIWSLGVVAFEAITGVRPFAGTTVGAITLAIHTSKPKMTAHVPDLPKTLDAWFAKACAQEPAARFATAREAANALLVALGESPRASLVRPPMMSLVDSAPALPNAMESSSKVERAMTNLSSAFPVARPSKRPPVALTIGAVAVVAVLAVVVVLALRKPEAPATTTTAAVTATDKQAAPVESALPPATATATATAEPAATAEPPPSSTASVAAFQTPSKPPVATVRPATTTKVAPRPTRGTPKKRDDDDIK